MTFLNPFLLVGLAAASIPIILHLLNLRRLKTIEFSTLQFLKELQRTKMRRVRIRQWLLLALRTLIIIAVVMAFARPALEGSRLGAIGTHAKTTVVILLDDSPSMTVRDEQGTMFAQAKNAALQILHLIKEGDEAYLVKLSDVHRQMEHPTVHSPTAMKTVVEELTPSQGTATFGDALSVAAKILTDSKNFNQEVHLITDAQATQFRRESPLDTLDMFDRRVRLFLVDVRKEKSLPPPNNTGISSVEIKSRIITQNKPVSLQAVVQNFNSLPLKNFVLSAYLDGVRVAQQSLEISPQSSTTSSFTLLPKRRGIIRGYFQIDDDALEIDNSRYFVLDVPENIRVLCVGGTQEETTFPFLALTADSDTSEPSLYTVRQIAGSQLSSVDLSRYDVLLLAGVKDFTSSVADRIAHFVKGGRGLIVFPGKDIDIENYNRILFSRLDIPPSSPAPSPSGLDINREDSGFLSFANIEFAHPLFHDLFEKPIDELSRRADRPNIESPKIYNAIVPEPGSNGQTIITLSNGKGFLSEYQAGAGRVLVYSVEAGLTWSDFPVKGLFVPLMHRSVIYLASQKQTTPSFVVGEEMKFTTKYRNQSGAFVLRSPSGIDERIVPRSLPFTGMVSFTSTNIVETGFYELRSTTNAQPGQNATVALAIPVNPPSEESDLAAIDDNELASFLAGIGLTPAQTKRLSVVKRIDTAVLESRFGVELWKHFVWLAVVLALVEMAIGREPKATASKGET